MKRISLALLFAVVVLLLVLTGCSGATSGDTLPGPAHSSSSGSSSATIGPEGGTVIDPSGAQLVVPPGALREPTRLTLAVAAPPGAAEIGAIPVGPMILAGPEGQTFLRPIQVVVPFDATRIAAGEGATDVQIRMAPHGSRDFVALQTDVDLAHGVVLTRTMHFTDFIAAVSPNPVRITTDPSLPQGAVGARYALTLAASGGSPPYMWSVSPGNVMPPGLLLSVDGSIAGRPTLPGNFEFFVTATDSASHAVELALFVTIVPRANPVPVLSAVTPSAVAQNSPATTIALAGWDFVPTSQVTWDGAPLPTTFVSAMSLAATVPSTSLVAPGTHQLAVVSPAPGGGASASLPFVVTVGASNPVPTIGSVSPSQIPVTNVDAQIAITGTGFIPTSSAVIGAQGIATTYVSGTALMAVIPASYLSTAGTLQIGVYNPGGGFSATTVPVTVQALHPVPTLSSLSPWSVVVGSATFTMTLTGNGFVTGGQAFFGATALATSVTSATNAQATVPASLLAVEGSTQITFVNPTPGGGASNSLTFTTSATPSPTGVTCTTTYTNSDCTQWTMIENDVTFRLITYNFDPQGAITSNSLGMTQLYNTSQGYPFFLGSAPYVTYYSAGMKWGTAVRSGTSVTVTFSGVRGGVIGCATPRYSVTCSGTTTLQ